MSRSFNGRNAVGLAIELFKAGRLEAYQLNQRFGLALVTVEELEAKKKVCAWISRALRTCN
jgi:hypothetical protein